MKIAIIGATGQLGSDLVNTFGEEAIPLGHDDIEVKDFSSCIRAFKTNNPDVAINCAAYVKVDDAEDFVEEAFGVNAIGTKNVAQACEKTNTSTVYISTDYVFDGTKGAPYLESDIPNPINVYGLSKYVGEFFTKNYSARSYIIRVSSIYGVKGARGKGGNFVETMIQKARHKEKIQIVNEIIMSPTYTKDAAEAIKKIVKSNLPLGIYHVTNKGYCSWYEFAKAIFDILRLDVNLEPIAMSELKSKARRPRFSALESTKLSNYCIEMRSWKEALKDYLIEKGYL
jgi:dTDP-4-dehydrorhamnose reductase